MDNNQNMQNNQTVQYNQEDQTNPVVQNNAVVIPPPKKKKGIIFVIIGVVVILLVLLVVLVLLPKKEEKPKDETPKEEKLPQSDILVDYITLKDVPSVFKENSSSDSHFGYYYDEGKPFDEQSCTLVIELTSDKSVEDVISKFSEDTSDVLTVDMNDIKWSNFEIKKTVKDPNTGKEYPVDYQYYVASVNGRVISLNLGYSGENSGKCFDYEGELLQSIHLVK